MLKKLSLYYISTNYNIFMTIIDIKILITNIFIDNIKIIKVKRSEIINQVKRKLVANFEVVDISHINFYVILKIERIWEKIILKLLELAYIDKILAKYHLNYSKIYNILIKKRFFQLNK